ncbi:DNA repair helicase XPB [Treponema porcinum]|uniref:DNA 3'-5' helicase n=2 Tax=Treponema porcinum TaxID=261392 RepID=A0A1T4JHP5_TREPO|nr:DNA repair helicase XPB [Treponema porcinum]SJZ29641.1 DNA excision repair protein ERCC-3 [Treponema porcinum]
MQLDNPLIVQSDRTLLLDVHAPLADKCRNELIPFAELERSPEHLHTYRLTPLSLWNASSAGFMPQDAVNVLQKYARYDVPQSVSLWITETAGRFGKLRMIPGPCVEVKSAKKQDGTAVYEQYLYLVTKYRPVFLEIKANPQAKKYLVPCAYDENAVSVKTELSSEEKNYCFSLKLTDRGTVKQLLLQSLWPVKDEIQLEDGEPLDFQLRSVTAAGKPFEIREYQNAAASALVGNKGPGTGFGTIVLPCGAGKTIVGMKIMDLLKTSTLIITTNISAVHQWIQELLDKTNLTEEQIAEYTGENKTIKQVTVATYQILTWRPEKDGPYPHFSIFRERPWGLIIYDEVHMLPAPVFRVVAELQAIRRVGLTATLVREDGCEGYVFSLVGPKRYDVPWKELEHSGWIATAECVEVRLDLPEEKEIEYAVSEARVKHRIASENPRKFEVAQEIINRYPQDKILVIGQYLEQLADFAKRLNAPIITGKTPNAERDKIYGDFRSGKIHVLVVSKVANFAIDLPDASVAIQVSGTFGSRQEEAQRLGRILRPKERMSRFFTLITRSTVEEDFGSNRQKFLAEQGYSYRIIRYTTKDDLNELQEGIGACNEYK